MGAWQLGFVVLCVAGGAGLAILPFLLEYRLAARLCEAQALEGVVSQIQKLEQLAGQISDATGKWQSVQEAAGKTAASAGGLADRMAKEVQAFSDFMERMNDGEKQALKLETEKLRRGEGEWLQVLVRMLDHIYALHSGALRSGQPNLIENLTNFQNACRDSARRVGLTPFQANPSEPFDPQRHQLPSGDNPAAPDAVVSETLAAGYTFQGRLLRPALVRLNGNGKGVAGDPAGQAQLPLQGKT